MRSAAPQIRGLALRVENPRLAIEVEYACQIWPRELRNPLPEVPIGLVARSNSIVCRKVAGVKSDS